MTYRSPREQAEAWVKENERYATRMRRMPALNPEDFPRSESEVQSAIRLRLGQLPDVRVWRNNVGQLSQRGAEGRKTTVRFGLCVGSSDLLCIVGPRGRWLAIEVKAEGWKPAKSGAAFQHEEEQRQWIAVVERFGGVGGFATNEDEAMALVERARTE